MTVRVTNPAMGYILIDATGSPVPLPYHTSSSAGTPVTIHNFTDTEVSCSTASGRHYRNFPSLFNLRIITEAEYMEKQS